MRGDLGRAALAVVGALTFTAVGCTTEERVLPRGQRLVQVDETDDDGEKVPDKEKKLLEEVDENPQSTRAWWQLGEYYEETGQYPRALDAYTRMKALIDQGPSGRKFTAGDYHLGRLYTKGRDYLRAIEHLKAVVAMQPKDPSEASLNRHFREAHYLLGAIYYENKQWEPSKKHFVTFRELGGEPERVEPWLAKIDEVQWAGEARAGRGRRPNGSTPAPQPQTPPQVPAAPTGGGQ